MQSNIYCTGGRTLKIDWKYVDGSGNGSVTPVALSEGVALVDIASKIGKVEKKPIIITLTNVEKGDMYLTDLTLGVYQEIDEDGNVVNGISDVKNDEGASAKKYQLYQTSNGLIVYGEIAQLQVYGMGGQKVAESKGSQFVNLSGISNGVYVVKIIAKDGSRVAQKFLKK